MRCSATARSSSAGSRSAPSGAMTTVPPAVSGAKISQPAASKLIVVFWRIRSSGPMPCLRTVQPTRFAMPAWSTRTPLGRPVDPEV